MLRVLRLSFIAGIANVLENLQTLAERAALARFASVADVGLYSHAQLYRSALFVVIKAASNAIWPRSLEEARAQPRRFHTTGMAWESIYVALTIAGIFAAFIGDDAIGFLTHGKFAASGPLVAGLIVVLLVQFSGKPQLALLYANDQGEFLGHLMGACALCALVMLFFAVPAVGTWGVLLALALQQILYRIGVHIKARRIGVTPFQDKDVLGGGSVVCLALLVDRFLQPPAWAAFLAACACSAAVAIWRKRAIRTGLSTLIASPG